MLNNMFIQNSNQLVKTIVRHFIFLSAAAAVMVPAACTKIEVDIPDQKIEFQVASYVTQTKSSSPTFLGELTSAPFSIAEANVMFNSVAFINADQGGGNVAAPARFFGAATTNQIETIKYYPGSTVSTWEPIHTYYWPKSKYSSLDFFSWFDLNATDDNHVANATYATNTYTLAWSGRTIALKDNVMYADPVWNQHSNTASTGVYGNNGVQEGVPTLFHHALAQVRFQFKQATMSEADSKAPGKSTFWEVTVKNVAIPSSKLVKTGSLSLTAAKNAAWTTPANMIWTPGSDYWASSDIFLANAANSTGITLTAAEQNFSPASEQMGDGYFTVLPQALGDDFLLNFDITIVTKYGNTDGSDEKTTISTETIRVRDFPAAGAITANGIQLNLMSTIGSYWQMNKKYTYLFNIDPRTSTILYDPAVENWTTGSSTQNIPNS